MNLREYRLALDALLLRVGPGIVGIILAVWTPGQDVAEVRIRATPLLVREVRRYRAEAHELAQDFLRTQAADVGVEDPYIPANPGYPEAAIDEILKSELRGPTNEAAMRISRTLERHVEASARQTVVRSAEAPDVDPVDESDIVRVERSRDDPDYADDYRSPILQGLEAFKPTPAQKDRDDRIRDEIGPRGRGRGGRRGASSGTARAVAWARVLTGAENCAFCVMLASRGPVYTNAEEGGRIAADEVYPDAKGFANSYHDDCDCVVVPVYTSKKWPGREQQSELESVWYSALEWAEAETGSYPSGRDALNALDRYLRHLESEGDGISVANLRDAA